MRADAKMLYAMAAVTATAGYAQAPWWAAVAGSCLIVLLLFQDEMRVLPPPGEEASWELAESLSNILIGGAAGGLAFAVGRLIGLLL
jgi:hypothetical protein